MTEEVKKRIEDINNGIVPEGYKRVGKDIIPDDWEQRKFGDVFSEYSEKNHEELPALTIIQGKGTIRRDESDRNIIYDEKGLKNYKLVKVNDFIVHLRSFEGGLEKANSDGIVSPAYHIFHGDKTDTRFYYPYFRSHTFINILLKPHVYGIRDGRSIDIEGMKQIIIPYPTYEEQRAIGDFFDSLDQTITLHQRKCDELKNLKKAYLTKMFPQKGQKRPEIRFSGFTDDWEQRKVGELGNIITGSTPSTKEKDNYGGEYLFVSPADIQENRYVENTITTLTEKGFNTGRILKPNSILFVSIGSTIGKVAQIKSFAITNQQINSIEPNDDYDADYVYILMQSMSDKISKLSATQAVPIINKSTFSDVNVFVSTKKEEQQQIGAYFKNLDTLITLHQRKCELLKMKKKALMQLVMTGKVRFKV